MSSPCPLRWPRRAPDPGHQLSTPPALALAEGPVSAEEAAVAAEVTGSGFGAQRVSLGGRCVTGVGLSPSMGSPGCNAGRPGGSAGAGWAQPPAEREQQRAVGGGHPGRGSFSARPSTGGTGAAAPASCATPATSYVADFAFADRYRQLLEEGA